VYKAGARVETHIRGPIAISMLWRALVAYDQAHDGEVDASRLLAALHGVGGPLVLTEQGELLVVGSSGAEDLITVRRMDWLAFFAAQPEWQCLITPEWTPLLVLLGYGAWELERGRAEPVRDILPPLARAMGMTELACFRAMAALRGLGPAERAARIDARLREERGTP
jgi:hypothetical protein